MSVKILIDSACDLTKTEADSLGIELLPIKVQFGDTEYKDGFDLLPDEFYDKLISSKEMPKTSLINEYTFNETFKRLTDEGFEVVAITLSSKLSGTYKCACEAAKNFENKVFVVDSLNATMGEKILGLYALQLAKENFSAQEIAKTLEEKKHKIVVTALVDTLKYLKKGGRISATTAFVGEMLSIKPLIAVIDGEVKVWGKAHGIKKAFLQIKSQAAEKGIDFSLPYGVIYSGNDKTNLNLFLDFAKDLWSETGEIKSCQIASTIGSHVGPGAIGIVFFQK